MDWQPIETAPKNERLLLLRQKDGDEWSGTFVGYWSHSRSSWMYGIGRRIPNPTHWMPLPEPPEQNGGDE